MGSDIRISLEDEARFRRWGKDPIAFICEAVKIEGKVNETMPDGKVRQRTKVIPFEMRDYQKDCLTRFLETQICAVLKARQIGLTTTACALALWLLLFQPNRFILVLSKNDKDAKKFMRRIKFMYERLPPWVKARAPQLVGRWGVEEAEFDNGSIIFSATSSSDHGRGDTPTDVFLDEIGKMRNQEDSWSALIPAVDEGGNLWMFGTANGFRDWFHLRWMEWEKDPDIDTIFYGWDVVEGRDENWAKRKLRQLGEALFRREYPATAEEAFVTSGSNVFSMEVLVEIEAEQPRRCRIDRDDTGRLSLVDDDPQVQEFGLFIFDEPEPGARYLLAGDPSEGLVDGDPSCAQVLRWSRDELLQVAVYRGRLEPDDFADLCHLLGQVYNRASQAIERNNHGHTVLKRMMRNRTPNVIRGGANRPGIWTAEGSKGTNIALTRKALADGYLKIRDQRTIDELMGFQEKLNKNTGRVTYEGNEHDDHVDALCLGTGYAVLNAPYERQADEAPPEEPAHPFSLEGLMSRRAVGARVI